MAQGTLTMFNEFSKTLGDGTHDMDVDTFKLALITTIPSATLASPNLSDFTEVSGAGYTAGGETLTGVTWTGDNSSGVASFKSTGTVQWAQNAGGPTDIMTGIIYNLSASNAAICFIDFSDGGAISLRSGDISWSAGTNDNIFTVS
jgi:hypothetical protein